MREPRNLIQHGGVDMDGVRVVKHMARLSEWKERIIDCRNSGQPVQAWCEQNGINPKTYYRWERLLMAEAVRIAAERPNSGSGALPGSAACGLHAQAPQAQVPCIVVFPATPAASNKIKQTSPFYGKIGARKNEENAKNPCTCRENGEGQACTNAARVSCQCWIRPQCLAQSRWIQKTNG